MRLLLYMHVYRERMRMSARGTCTHQQDSMRVCACLCVSKSYPCVCVDHIPVRVCACLCVSKSYPCVSKSYGLAVGRAAGHLKERKSGLTLG